MRSRSPVLAIGWEIWARSRTALVAAAGLIGGGTVLVFALQRSERWIGFANALAYTLTGLALLMTLFCFHFTEGSKKGGFGSFPARLFHLPMRTGSLVGLPMLYGSGAMVILYLLCWQLLLRQAAPDLPLLWPCLYLVFGLTQFQMIVWSLPESRYLKLLCLSAAASVVTFGWMFFIPSIIDGALSEWGYDGSLEVFKRGLLVVLALTGPAAYAVGALRVRQQRHGRTDWFAAPAGWWDKSASRLWRRRRPFSSADHAILWQEWRRTGYILPLVLVVVIALACVPSWLSGGVSGRATMGILTWIFLAPILFALIIGRGFGKPDFWSASLSVAPFHAVRPVRPGQWVAAKLKVAFLSAALTWVVVIYLGFMWTAVAGDFHRPENWLRWIEFYYSPAEHWGMLVLGLPAAIIVTWRFMVAGLPSGLSGSELRYYAWNLLVGGGLVGLFVLTIWRADGGEDLLRLYHVWPAVGWLPVVLTVAVAVKMGAAVMVWSDVLKREMSSVRSVVIYFGGWLLATTILAAFLFLLCRNTPWLRNLLLLGGVLVVPLGGPARAIRALAANRSNL